MFRTILQSLGVLPFFFHSRLAAFLLSRFTSSVLPPYSWVLRPLLTSCHSLLLPLSELTRPPRVRVHSFTSCNCRLYIRRFRLVFGLRIILHSHPLRLPIDDFCSSVQGFAICFFQPVHHCTHLADSLALPTSGRARDFHPIECTHAEHTKSSVISGAFYLPEGFIRTSFYCFLALR